MTYYASHRNFVIVTWQLPEGESYSGYVTYCCHTVLDVPRETETKGVTVGTFYGPNVRELAE